MLIDILREAGISGAFDPYDVYGEDNDTPGPVDPVDCAGSADLAAMLKGMQRLYPGQDLVEGLRILIHGMGELVIADPVEGRSTTHPSLLSAIETLTTSQTNHPVLREARQRYLCFCPIFLVAKDNHTSRFIFDGRKLNAAMLTPPAVNLPSMDEFQQELRRLGGKQFAFITIDYRHWFHQIKLHNLPIGVKIRDQGALRYFAYQTLPMGLSWSPFLAETVAWASILFRTAQQKELFEVPQSRRTPRFVPLKDLDGFACIMYDNIIIVASADERSKDDPKFFSTSKLLQYVDRIMGNGKTLGVRCKVAEAFCPPSTPTGGVMERFTFVKDSNSVKLTRDRAGNRLPNGQGNPTILGVEFFSTGSTLQWRHAEKRVTKAKTLAQKPSRWTPREIAKRVGLVIWHAIVSQIRLGRFKTIIDVLRSFQITKKTDWDLPIAAPPEDWWHLTKAVLDAVVINEPVELRTKQTEESLILCASDASDTVLGGVVYDGNGDAVTWIKAKWIKRSIFS